MFEEFKNKKWYRQGGLVVPFFENAAMSTMTEIVGKDGYVGIYRAEKNHGYFNKEKLKEGAYFNIKEQLKNGKKKLGVWGLGYIGFSSIAHFSKAGVT